MRVIELAFGVRRDLNLNTRWWHRLAKVMFALGCAGLVALATFVAYDGSRRLRADEVSIKANLRDFNAKADKSVPNSIPAFLQLDGQLGVLDKAGVIDYMSEADLARGACSPDMLKHRLAVAHHLVGDSTSPTALSDAYRELEVKDGQFATCVFETNAHIESSASIIKYEPTISGKVRRFTLSLVAGLLVTAFLAVIAANLYYRGLIYVAFGPMKRAGGSLGTPPPLKP